MFPKGITANTDRNRSNFSQHETLIKSPHPKRSPKKPQRPRIVVTQVLKRQPPLGPPNRIGCPPPGQRVSETNPLTQQGAGEAASGSSGGEAPLLEWSVKAPQDTYRVLGSEISHHGIPPPPPYPRNTGSGGEDAPPDK